MGDPVRESVLATRKLLCSHAVGLAPCNGNPRAILWRRALQGIVKSAADQEDDFVQRHVGLLWIAERLEKARPSPYGDACLLSSLTHARAASRSGEAPLLRAEMQAELGRQPQRFRKFYVDAPAILIWSVARCACRRPRSTSPSLTRRCWLSPRSWTTPRPLPRWSWQSAEQSRSLP